MRVTRLAVEALGHVPSVIRTSRTTLEVLGQGPSVLQASRINLEATGTQSSSLRTSRLTVEVIGEQVAPQLRTSRVGVEVLGGVSSTLLLSRLVTEVLGEQVVPWLWVSRLGVEVLGEAASQLNSSRLNLEVLGEQVAWLRTSRLNLEALGSSPTGLRVSRLVFEVLGGLVGVCASQLQLTDVAVGVVSDPIGPPDSPIPVNVRRESKSMFTFEAPYPAIVTTTFLPNPQFSDSEALLSSVSRKTAVDGTRYTYVKRRDRRKLKWTFRLSRPKSLELFEFFRVYSALKIRVTDHNSRVWVGNFTSNPLDLDIASKAAPAIAPMPRGELVSVDVEFEGTEV